MRVFLALLTKETLALFLSPIAYAVIAVFVLLMGYTFTMNLFLAKTASLVHIFFQAAALMLLIVPIITMRQFAEERKGGTLELLLTAPVRESAIVLAKFCAAFSVTLVMIGLTAVYAVILGIHGAPDWGPVYAGYIGLVMIAAALVSLGVMISALTSNQIVAAIVTLGLFSLMWMIDTLASLLPTGVENVLVSLSLLAHFTPFATGALYTSDFGFFVVMTLLGLFLATRALARR
ncbi:MAG: ABC transporter permease subunit [Burkholderiales bacterium]|nr:ABC transporter permease subunit [Burkholderiales bacterium]